MTTYRYVLEDTYIPGNKTHEILVDHMEEVGWEGNPPNIIYNVGKQLYSENKLPAEVKNKIINSMKIKGSTMRRRSERVIKRSKKRPFSPARRVRVKRTKKRPLSPARRVPVKKSKKSDLGPARRVPGRGFDKKKLKCNTPVKSYKPLKKKMVRACSRGKEKLIHFGATGYGNNYSPGARRAFRARHKCSKAKDKLTARYWACHNLWAGPGGDTRQPPKKRRVKGGKRKKSPVSLKISQLVKEGYPHKQAVAIALSMQESGRITKSGGYRRHKRSSRRRRKRSSSRRRKRSSRRRKRSSSRRRKRSSRRRKRSSRRCR